MIQDILTYLTVVWAFYQVFMFFWRLFKPKHMQSACGSGGCTSCEAKTELFEDIGKGKFPTLIQDKIKVQ
ncbi:FeoB-associated Cys-rich membrane protein [Carboxylicivirga sp. N1Y90]|uniref:FeoB-associated Cys-rich membrane protein n=1 Tax=Carboxylicivirga fragile TaxID=3417571 RepID=UPI003D33C668|nr:hypothetical protein [Marinilabiliaceae bacterium N1Y90]